MPGSVRFFIGFLLGILLTGVGFALAGIGHGTYAALVCSAGILGFIFLPFSLFLAPFEWGLYLLLIPTISSPRWRLFCVAAVIASHLVPGLWLATTDAAFARAMNQDAVTLLVYTVLLLLTLTVLTLVGLRGARSQKN